MHTCARTRAARSATEDSHPDRSGAQSSENPQVSFRTPVADRGLARWQSIIPRTQKPTQARARWQSIPSAAISGFPLPPTDPRESCGMPVAGRRSAGTSAGVHPRKTSHASAATYNRCAKRAQREARRRGPALQQAPDAVLSLLSRETERSGHLPHGGVDGNMPAQPAPRRRAVGSSTGKSQATIPKREHAHARGQQPDTVNWRAAPRLLRGSSRAGLYANSASIA